MKIEGIKRMHHIHVWRLDEKNTILEGHVQTNDMLISESMKISDKIQHSLEEHFEINHTVIQFESAECQDGKCSI